MSKLTLLDDFKSWLEGKGYKPTVSSSYASYLRTLFRKLYSGGYSAIPNAEELLNNAVICPTLIKGLLEYFDIAINSAFENNNGSITEKQLNNGRSAFRKFVEFMLGHASGIHNNMQNIIQPASKSAPKYIKPAKAYQNMMGWKNYTRNDIVRIIKSRLGTQDRLSGDKVWLSPRVVKGLLGSEWFDNWCKSIISKTKVLIDNRGGFVMLDQVDELILKPDSDGKYSVWVVVCGQEYRVYTHYYIRTSKGMIITIEPMFVDGMKDVTLDHVKSIHQTLNNWGGKNKLPELSKISDLIKQVSQTINSHNGAKIKSNISTDKNQISSDNPKISVVINLDELRKEMDIIKDDTDYELMNGSNNDVKGKNS